uniref:Helitron helicase-like domain-containing protein n=1 Tax=Tanacetum cinerariifolium TaxID=118510 RepID=A0A699I1K2_TANCI|nr:helitron helicase-like domain-containing protein [Tanacetum cinerariifolium]
MYYKPTCAGLASRAQDIGSNNALPKGVSSLYMDIGGKVVLEDEREPLDYIKHLFEDHYFLENIRAYNKMFNMTSFDARVDDSINNGRGPYVFKIFEQIYHYIDTLFLFVGDPPRDKAENDWWKKETYNELLFKAGRLFQLHERFDSYDLLFRDGRLFQQYVVGVYRYIKQNQTDYYRQHQVDIRKDYLSDIYDAISRGDHEDALAICRVLGVDPNIIDFA